MASVNTHFAVVTADKILQLLTVGERAVLLPSSYMLDMLIKLFSSILVNSGF